MLELPKIEDLKQKLTQLEGEMAAPDIVQNAAKLKELTQAHADAKSLLELLEARDDIERQIKDNEELASGDDEEMSQLAQEELVTLRGREEKLDKDIEEMLIPKDPRDARDVILEIRAGAGGEEAALFAGDLFRAYSRYAEIQGWKTHVVNSSHGEQGGIKEIVAEISGKNVFGVLKFEIGVHRVQRVPDTEKQGRIHTSTVTVAVLPQAEEVDVEINPADVRMDTYRASGAGGQHVNKTSSAVRLTHEPTGVVVAVQDERSQHKNREKAMKVLRAKILEMQEATLRQAQGEARKSQVGTGDRSEKIRTYNYPQDRVTDHRIKQSWSNMPKILDGQMEDIFETLRAEDRKLKMGK